MDIGSQSEDWLNGNFQIIYTGGSTITPDLSETLYGDYYSTNYWSPHTWSDGRYDAQLDEIISEVDLPKSEVNELYYYGSGCLKAENAMVVGEVLRQGFPNSVPAVSNDMMGAARALFGNEKGIACILGTGANSCLYDGDAITDRAVSLGYLVGDEGSGCYIGRKLVRAYFYDLMPLKLKLEFNNTYHLEISDFIEHVYHQPEASRYLAGFVRFAGDHIDHPFIQDLVKGCFNDFIQAFVLRYKNCHDLRVGFVGSVAFYFQYQLHECLSAEGLTMGKVMRSPMEGLIQMYS